MTTEQLISWTLSEHEAQKRTPPTRLHSQGNREDDPTTRDPDNARGLPFSKSFEKYLDGSPINTPARQALQKMHTHSRKQSDEYRIAHAILVTGDISAPTRYPSQVVYRALSTLKELATSIA